MSAPRLIGLALALLLLLTAPARAATTLLRDADMEYALQQLAAPVLTAAGLSPTGVKVLVVDDSSLNAFVASSRHIFIHSGLINRLDSAAQLQAVMAHEAAHISNGHLTRRLGNMQAARTAAGLGLALAAAAAAAGGGEAAAGLAIGTQSSALRRLLTHTRAEESSADLSSIRYLVSAGVDPNGAIEVQELFSGQEALAVGRQDPYMRTHPLNRDRLRALRSVVAGYRGGNTRDSAAADYWFARAQGKLSAFTRAPSWTLRRLGDSGTQDIALMREAVARHRQSDTEGALRAIDRAIAMRGNDPYYMELKGQILLESRRFGQAVQVYRAAANGAPREAQIMAGLGRSLVATEQYAAALDALEAARGRDPSDARMLRDMAVAYARTGQPGMASLVTAERYALQARFEDAELHAERAMGRLPRGSGPWQRAQDVLSAAERAQER